MIQSQVSHNYKALVVHKNSNDVKINIEEKSTVDLPRGDLLIKVKYSSLNYKDALSASGARGITNKYPHTPGIDAAGIIEESNNDQFPTGLPVIVTGFDLGMNTSGGFSEYIRVPSNWALKCPDGMTAKESMMIGTAGLTAGLCVNAIAETIKIKDSKIIVSGATGGVGCLSIKLLSHLGAKVTALTGKMNKKDFLFDLGATKVIDRMEFVDSTRLPLNKKEYHGAVDVVGGKILSSIIARLDYGGKVAVCGNVGGPEFNTTVFPFILRSNSLIGIDSAECPINKKKIIWKNFANKWKLNSLEKITKKVSLQNLIPEIQKILIGKQAGRVLIKL